MVVNSSEWECYRASCEERERLCVVNSSEWECYRASCEERERLW